jgi:hypothetical protein
VLAEGGDLQLEDVGDVDVGVVAVGAVQPDLAHVVRLKTFLEQLGEDEAGLRRRKHGVEGDVGGDAMVRMVHVAVAVEAHGGIAAHDGVRPIAADEAREIAPHRDGGLQHAVLVAEEDDLRDAEDGARRALLLLPDLQQTLARHVGGGGVVGAGVPARDAHADDLAPRPRPRRQRARHRELLVVGMRVNRHHACRRLDRLRGLLRHEPSYPPRPPLDDARGPV